MFLFVDTSYPFFKYVIAFTPFPKSVKASIEQALQLKNSLTKESKF